MGVFFLFPKKKKIILFYFNQIYDMIEFIMDGWRKGIMMLMMMIELRWKQRVNSKNFDGKDYESYEEFEHTTFSTKHRTKNHSKIISFFRNSNVSKNLQKNLFFSFSMTHRKWKWTKEKYKNFFLDATKQFECCKWKKNIKKILKQKKNSSMMIVAIIQTHILYITSEMKIFFLSSTSNDQIQNVFDDIERIYHSKMYA